MELAESLEVPRDLLIQHLSAGMGVRPKRKRGAPFGNQNARKHGLYSKFLTPERIKILDQANGIEDLAHEITIIRLRLDTLLADPNTSSDEIYKTVSILGKLIIAQQRLSRS